MRVTIVGGSGFIGTRLIDLLRQEGVALVPPTANGSAEEEVEIRNVDLLPSRFFNDITTIGDARRQDDMDRAMEGTDIAVLLASVHHDNVRPVELYYETNVGGGWKRRCGRWSGTGETARVLLVGGRLRAEQEEPFGGASDRSVQPLRAFEMASGRDVATLARDTFGLEREHRAPHRDFRRTQPRQRLQLVAPNRKRQVSDGGQRRQPQIDGLRGQHRGVREISHRKPHGGIQCVQLRGQARLHDERPRGARRKRCSASTSRPPISLIGSAWPADGASTCWHG